LSDLAKYSICHISADNIRYICLHFTCSNSTHPQMRILQQAAGSNWQTAEARPDAVCWCRSGFVGVRRLHAGCWQWTFRSQDYSLSGAKVPGVELLLPGTFAPTNEYSKELILRFFKICIRPILVHRLSLVLRTRLYVTASITAW